MSIAFVVGARPEIIKIEALLKEAISRGLQYEFIHTGQHYDWDMSLQHIKDLDLPEPDKFLNEKIEEASNIGEIYINTNRYLSENKPKVVVVVGDTNSTLGVSLAACGRNVSLVHVEAGCRSFDWSMPEEKNRVIVSDCADIHLAPTMTCLRNLKAENVRGEVFLTGHPIVRTVHQQTMRLNDREVMKRYGLEPHDYVFLTLHRQENVDHKPRLQRIIRALSSIDKKILFPIHPRTMSRLRQFNLEEEFNNIKNVVATTPISYIQTLGLVKNASFVVTDSGGLQQEAFLMETPCITIRNSFEWVETFEAGVNFLLDPDREGVEEILKMMNILQPAIKAKFKNVAPIFGCDDVPTKIIDLLYSHYTL